MINGNYHFNLTKFGCSDELYYLCAIGNDLIS